MATRKKESSGSFAVTIIFILSIVVLILMFVLFTRDQGTKVVEDTLSNLAKTNAELREEQKAEKQKSIDDRLVEAGFDPNNLWEMTPCENVPYCTFLNAGTGEGDYAAIRAIERWYGHVGGTDEGTNSSCDIFVMDQAVFRPINMELLAPVEQTILKDAKPTDPIEITVYRSEDEKRDEKSGDPCAMPAYVLNVHLK